MHADLQRLLADDLLADFASKPMDRLRSLRVQLNEAESDVSFVRRVTQGRLDIVGHEVDRRTDDPDRSGAGPSAAAETRSAAPPAADGEDSSSSLLFEMPDILTDGESTGGSRLGPRSAGTVGRAVTVNEPGPVALALIEGLDGIASPSQLSGIHGVARPELADLFDGLREFELEMSSIRRLLHDRIDTIQDEIARRYRDGEASVDALLQ